jgi:hypothetical protein
LKAGLAVLQQPYSSPAGQQLLKHLRAAAHELNAQDPEKIHRFWSRQKPGVCIVQVLQLADQYLQWLVPVYAAPDMAATSTSTSTSSSSSNSGSTASLTPILSCQVHVACIIMCLQLCACQLQLPLLLGDKAAAAVRMHLLQPSTGGRPAVRHVTSADCLL